MPLITDRSITASTSVPRLVVSERIDAIPYDFLRDAFWSGQMPHYRVFDVPAVENLLAVVPDHAEVVRTAGHTAVRCVLAALPDMLLLLQIWRDRTSVQLAGRDPDEMTRVLDEVTARARSMSTSAPDEVDMRLWMSPGGQTTMSTRRVEAPAWVSIANGYASATRAALSALVSMTSLDGRAGRLLLWYGEPGTGKTTAVRMLAREWAGWCDAHYITDPELFFRQHGYVLEVAGAGSMHEPPRDDQYRFVIVEDCDEYLRADARHRAGASLGRLLNLSDGILGHGLRVVVLLTTNEDIGRLHPAVTRPGRCLGQVRFDRLGRTEARTLLGPGLEPRTDAMTLAELYAQRSGYASTAATLQQLPVGHYL